MKRTFFGAMVALTVSMLGSGCSRDAIEAVNLANEGDQSRATDIDGAI